MSAVVRIALSCFSFVPVQRWVNIIGAALLGIGVLVAVMNFGNSRAVVGAVSALGMLGMALIVLAPGYGGGIALRFATTRSLLHLRPYGRIRMLLGATLAITMVAVLITLPLLASHLLLQHYTGRVAPGTMPPLKMLQFAWSITVALWIATFAVSGRPMLLPVIAFGPLLISTLRKTFLPRLEPLLPAGPPPDPSILFIVALAAWASFAIWYTRTDSIRPVRLAWGRVERGRPFSRRYLDAYKFMDRFHDKHGMSRARAMQLVLLGKTSWSSSVAMGVMLTITMLLISRVLGIPDRMQQIPGYYLLMFIIVSAPLGLLMVARSRLLWLRAGPNRDGLFRLAEKAGLGATSLTVGIGVIGFLTISLLNRPDLAVAILIFTAAQIAFSLCLFYLGMHYTRGWDAESVLFSLGLLPLYFVLSAASQPTTGAPLAAAAAVPILFLFLAWLLRQRARSRWLILDWRMARFKT